jgi:hypothetical protein
MALGTINPRSRSTIGHHALHLDAELGVIGDRLGQERGRAALPLAGHQLGKSDAGMIVDGDVEVFPAHAPAVALPGAVARDPVSPGFSRS